MKNQVMNLPSAYFGKADKYIPEITSKFERFIKKAEAELQYEDLKLEAKERGAIASLLVDLFEDIRHEKGLWSLVEDHHEKVFDVFIPVLASKAEESEKNLIRIQYFLWILFSEIRPGFILSPSHPDLLLLARNAMNFLDEAFSKVPMESGVQKYLHEAPQTFGRLKEKLVWLGMHSFLFRVSFDRYLMEHKGLDEHGKIDVNIADDFLTWEPSCWSSLGVNEVLGGLLTEKSQSDELTSWKDKHTAWFLIDYIEGSTVFAQNIINGESYKIDSGDFANQYEAGNVVFSSLVKWKGAWHWTGQQQKYPSLKPEEALQLRNTFMTQFYSLACNYSPMLAENAKNSAKSTYEKFVSHFDTNLLAVNSGHELQEQLKSFDLLGSSVQLPESLLNSDNGVALFMNPEEGYEIAINFNTVIASLKKESEPLDAMEEDALRGFVFSKDLSINFIEKLISEYGENAFVSSFLISGNDLKHLVKFLFYRYKGIFLRTRYPKMIFQTPD